MSEVRSAAHKSAQARMNIGEVHAELREEFPSLLLSKLRYFESEGLVVPTRTPAGYRKYSHQDVERLRYALTLQRDHHLPLKIIKEHLDALDRGLEPPQLPVRASGAPAGAGRRRAAEREATSRSTRRRCG